MTDVMSTEDGEELAILIIEIGYATGVFDKREAERRLYDHTSGDSLLDVSQLLREWKAKYFPEEANNAENKG